MRLGLVQLGQYRSAVDQAHRFEINRASMLADAPGLSLAFAGNAGREFQNAATPKGC